MTLRSIIMKKMDRGEADETVRFISREKGWLTGVAKNSRKSRIRFGGHLEPMSIVDMVVRSRQKDAMVWIDESQIRKAFTRIRGDMGLVAISSYFLELASVFLPEGQQDTNVFDFMDTFLTSINEAPPDPTELVLYEIHLLSLLGYGPMLVQCAVCRRSFSENVDIFFSPHNGGLCHRSCTDEMLSSLIRISPSTLATLRHLLDTDSRLAGRIKIGRVARSEIRQCLSAFVRHIRGEDLKSLSFMEQIGIN